MKAVQGFKLRPLGSDYILVPQSSGLVNFNKLISFNSSAAYLWESISSRESFTQEELSSLLVEKYSIDKETADRDSAKILEKWLDTGIVAE